VDPGTLPAVTADADVSDFIAGGGLPGVVVTLAQNLEFENQALLRRDESILTAVDHGDRLLEMQNRLQSLSATSPTTVVHYRFATIHATLLIPFGKQDGFSIGLRSTGTKTEETYVRATLQSRVESAFDQTFAVRRATGDRWLLVAVLPPG
jgi:hypothetical protein